MSNEKRIKLELTPEQQNQVREVTGADASAIEFSVEELEERIAPVSLGISQLEDRIAPAQVFPTGDL